MTDYELVISIFDICVPYQEVRDLRGRPCLLREPGDHGSWSPRWIFNFSAGEQYMFATLDDEIPRKLCNPPWPEQDDSTKAYELYEKLNKVAAAYSVRIVGLAATALLAHAIADGLKDDSKLEGVFATIRRFVAEAREGRAAEKKTKGRPS